MSLLFTSCSMRNAYCSDIPQSIVSTKPHAPIAMRYAFFLSRCVFTHNGLSCSVLFQNLQSKTRNRVFPPFPFHLPNSNCLYHNDSYIIMLGGVTGEFIYLAFDFFQEGFSRHGLGIFYNV